MAKVKTFIWVGTLAVLQIGHHSKGQNTTSVDVEFYTRTPSEQTGNDTEGGFPPIGENVLSSSLDKGMVPIYDLTKFFLEKVIAVHPLTDLSAKVNLADEDAVLDSLENDWEMWVDHYIAYTIATLIGVFFCLCMPILGCFICCCRKSGRCGGKFEPIEKKHEKCHRIICGSLLLLFSVVILLGTTSCFLSTRLVRDQTVPTGTMQDISSSLLSVDMYFDNTQEQIWNLKSRLFETPYHQIQFKLRTFSSDVKNEVRSTGEEPLYHSLETYVQHLPDLLGILEELENSTQNLYNHSVALNNTIDKLVANFLTDFQLCNLDECNGARYTMETLMGTANFTGQNLEPIKQDIESVLYGSDNITVTLQQAEDEYYNQLETNVAVVCNSTISQLQTELENYADDFYGYINDTISKLSEMSLSKTRQDINDTITKEVDEIGHYAFISLNIIASIALLVVTLFFIALLFGCCGDRAAEDATFCNRGKGASALIVAMVILFLFSWILMICTTAMFLAGGLSYTEMCRHLIFKESQEDLVVLDNMITSYFNMSGPSARTMMTNCDQNLPFYKAFEVEIHYPDLNISKILDLSAFDFDGVLEELVSQNYTGGVVMVNNETETHLIAIETSIQDVDMELYRNMAEQEITNHNLVKISKLFEGYANDLESTYPALAVLFRNYSEQLTTIHQVQVTALETEMNEITDILASIETFDASMNLSVFIPEMESAQSSITNEVTRNVVNVTLDVIFDDITRLASSIEFSVVSGIGRCSSVYNAISVSLSSVCVSFFYPFNAFWFSLGGCLLFFTLCIPIAFSLVTHYRKTEPHTPLHQAAGRPRLHRGRSFNQDDVRSSLGSSRGQHPYDYQRPMPSAPPLYDGTVNNGFVPDELPDYNDNGGFIDYHRNGYPHPPRGNPIRPTENYMIELRPKTTSYNQQTQGENDCEDYF